MDSAADGTIRPSAPDYYARALALWPRLGHPRPARVRRDPRRIATLISRRTSLSYRAILELLGAPADKADPPDRDH
ncbi:MAG: hypothetical protein ABSD62_01765 [Candidatus Limnocylindrales bacterium]|jgi:hypothetical protein